MIRLRAQIAVITEAIGNSIFPEVLEAAAASSVYRAVFEMFL
jgi:hypothetical protein